MAPDSGERGRLRRAVDRRVTRARDLLGSVSDAAFLASAFRGLLQREPEDAGVEHYAPLLHDGRLTREDVLWDIARGSELAGLVLHQPGFRAHVHEFCEARRAAGGHRPVCFLHLMKCGGTAFADGLSALASPWPQLVNIWIDHLVCLPRPLLCRAMLVTGHLPYQALELLDPDTAAVTIIREPVARTLSHYVHVRDRDGHLGLTLDAFVLDDAWRPRWVDYQARQLAHTIPVEDAWMGRFPTDPDGRAGLPLQSLLDSDAVFDGAGDVTAAALARLDAIDLVGVQDDLDGTLRRVAELWGKPPPAPLAQQNPSAERLRPDAIPGRVLDEIVAGTAADAALYQRACRRAAAEG